MADIIVKPKVLASQNPDTYNNLIMAQAQNATNVTTNINGNAISDIFETNGTIVKNATNAASATNGIFTQTFSSYSDFYSWYDSQEPSLIIAHFQFAPNITITNSVQVSISDNTTQVSRPSTNYLLEEISIVNDLGVSTISYATGQQQMTRVKSSGPVSFTHNGIYPSINFNTATNDSSLTVSTIYLSPIIESTDSMSITVSYFS